MYLVRILLIAATLLLAFSLTVVDTTSAQSGCGLKPLKPMVPIGCADLEAVCQCDVRGQNCRWQWVCVPKKK